MNTSFTPAIIVEENKSFSIPLYQRLFEWNVENIEVLLDDLHRAFINTPGEDYYIGLLTSTSEGELVDGQQRFTVLTLLGCVLRDFDSRWNQFLNCDNPRLNFLSRPKDTFYLRRVMAEGFEDIPDEEANYKMQQALKAISGYINDANKVEDAAKFSSYIFDHLRFFISTLPQKYSPRALNKYFERMNSTGKNLEQHEILKVKLLGNLDGNISPLMQLWNKIAEVDTELLRIRRYSGEDDYGFKKRRESMLSLGLEDSINNGYVNGVSESAGSRGNIKSIREIEPSEKSPKREDAVIRNSKSLLSFPIILLLVLYWKLRDENKPINSLRDFFNPANLLETFARYLPYEGNKADKDSIRDYIHRLLKARLILDYCFVRSSDNGYSLEMASEESEEGRTLLMWESLLYVSSNRYSYYKWFYKLMDYISKRKLFPSEAELYSELKRFEDETVQLPPLEKLGYNQDESIRYWFWRLDFYIWQNRKELFRDNSEALRVAENYRFMRNRSIEHVAPQHPLENSYLQWEDTDEDTAIRNSFGNLVMISNGLNSALCNQPYEVKKAHVQAYTNGSMNGSIESLSLLLINTAYDTWDREKIKSYGATAYGFLKDSCGSLD